jgi:hypothetical protein
MKGLDCFSILVVYIMWDSHDVSSLSLSIVADCGAHHRS